MESKSESGANAGSVGVAKRKSGNVCPNKSADFVSASQEIPRGKVVRRTEGRTIRRVASASRVRTGEREEGDTRTGKTGIAATVKGGVVIGDKDENVGEAERGQQLALVLGKRGNMRREAPSKGILGKEKTEKEIEPKKEKMGQPMGTAEKTERHTATKPTRRPSEFHFGEPGFMNTTHYETHRCGIKATSQESTSFQGGKKSYGGQSRHSSADRPGVSYRGIGRPGKVSGRVIWMTYNVPGMPEAPYKAMEETFAPLLVETPKIAYSGLDDPNHVIIGVEGCE
ncbi:hypothetical protein FB451DRAFT_1179006 [Mycena latifolia]|nr:hypothetical protein FB451DRAFT_1179006 [Mycena latifolia]